MLETYKKYFRRTDSLFLSLTIINLASFLLRSSLKMVKKCIIKIFFFIDTRFFIDENVTFWGRKINAAGNILRNNVNVYDCHIKMMRREIVRNVRMFNR